MAYTHSKYEVMMIPVLQGATIGGQPAPSGVDHAGLHLGITGLQAWWGPGFVPHIIRGAAVVNYTKHAGDLNIHVGFEADISVPGTATRMFTIMVPTGGGIGKAYYHRPTQYIEIKPGMRVVARVTAAATSLAQHGVILYVEPRWEEPQNVTTMATSVGAS